MRTRRRDTPLGLALLDVMACGLGAVILLFLIIKHNTGSLAEPTPVDTTHYQTALDNLQAQKDLLTSEIEQQARLQEIYRDSQAELEKANLAKTRELRHLQQQIEAETQKKSSLEQQVATQQPRQTVDVVENIRQSEEDYLIGLKVEGRNIVLLVDSSASMTDEKLIDIITRKFKSSAAKQQGPKWQRTMRTVKWLLNRLPEGSEVGIVAFNETAEALNGGKWTASKDANGIESLFDEINGLIPSGATHLGAGLEAVTANFRSVSDLYIVTDGLPTKGRVSALLSAACGLGRDTVSGQCRLEFFRSSTNRFLRGYGSKINVILMPLEGDPEAVAAYWTLAAHTGGTLLSPAAGWP